MKNIALIIVLCILVVFCLTCKKPTESENITPVDTIPPVKDMCELTYNPAIPIPNDFIYFMKPSQYYTPMFNPNNGEECVLIKQELYDYNLIKMNLATGKFDILYHQQNGIISNPNWHKNDWILFCNHDLKIMKIKSNGDSLTQLTQEGYGHYPIWNTKGDKIMYWNNKGTFIMDADGNNKQKLFDTSYKVVTLNSDNNLVLGWAYNTLAYTDFGKAAINKVYSNPLLTAFGIWGVSWLPNNKEFLVTTNHGGLYKLNTETEVFTQLIDSCKAESFLDISVSPNGDKLLMQKAIFSVDSLNETWMDNKIFLMDINGKNEKEIFITE